MSKTLHFGLVGLLVFAVSSCTGGSSLPASGNQWCVDNADKVESFIDRWEETEADRDFKRQQGLNLSSFDFPGHTSAFPENSDCFPAEIRAWFDAGSPRE